MGRGRILFGLLLLAGCEESLTPEPADEVLFDFELPLLAAPGHNLKDHAVIQHAGRVHVFSIINVLGSGQDLVERSQRFAHFSSRDLRHWEEHPSVVPAGTQWREQFVWAPFVVRDDDAFAMFFTGVDRFMTQRTGEATSTDLYHWRVDPTPLHHPDPTWADWEPGRWSDGRDPMVLWHDGAFHLFTAAQARTAEGPRGAVGHAVSADGRTWRDLPPLLVGPGPAVPESPFVVRHDGTWHLFLSWGDAEGIEHRAATTLDADWAQRPATSLGRGHASEVFQRDGRWFLSRFDGYVTRGPDQTDRHETALFFDRLEWATDPLAAPTVTRDPWGGDWIPSAGPAFETGPAFGENPTWRDQQPLGVQGAFFLSSGEKYRGPLRSGKPGDHHENGEAVGSIRSRPFRLRHSGLRLDVGGDYDPAGLWVRLRSVPDDRVLLWTTGPGHPAFAEVRWDTSPWLGDEVVLEVVDANPTASISLDHVRGVAPAGPVRDFR